jgi:hypothetical protein
VDEADVFRTIQDARRRWRVGRVARTVGHFRPRDPRDRNPIILVEPKDPAADIAEFDRILVASGLPQYLWPATAYDRLTLSGPPDDLARATHVLVTALPDGAFRREGMILEPEGPTDGPPAGEG